MAPRRHSRPTKLFRHVNRAQHDIEAALLAEADAAFPEEIRRECRCLADLIRNVAFREFRIEELHIAEDDELQWPEFFNGARHRHQVFTDGILFIHQDRLWRRRVLESRKKIIRQLAFQPTMSGAAGVHDDELSRAKLPRLSTIIEVHPEQTDVVPEPAKGCAVDAEFEV